MLGRVLRAIRTPLTLLVLLAVLCYGAWWGWEKVVAPAPAAQPEPCVETQVEKGTLKSSQVTVNVLNGGRKRGLAGTVGEQLLSKKFKIDQIGNTDREIETTIIVGAGEKNPEVLLVKGFFKGAAVEADDRSDHSVDVLVGNKYGGFQKKAKTSIAVKTETVCLPKDPEQSAVPAGE